MGCLLCQGTDYDPEGPDKRSTSDCPNCNYLPPRKREPQPAPAPDDPPAAS